MDLNEVMNEMYAEYICEANEDWIALLDEYTALIESEAT